MHGTRQYMQHKKYEAKISNEIAQMSSLTRAYTRQAHIPQLTSLAVKHLCRSILLTFLHKCLLTNQTDRRLLWNASTKTLLNNSRHYTYLYTGINICVVAAINLGCYQSRMLSISDAIKQGNYPIPLRIQK